MKFLCANRIAPDVTPRSGTILFASVSQKGRQAYKYELTEQRKSNKPCRWSYIVLLNSVKHSLHMELFSSMRKANILV